jgi:hypothetical protein
MTAGKTQLALLSRCIDWATTGETVLAVAAAGQKVSLKPAGKAFRMVALSRCKVPRRLSIVISPLRSLLAMKLITMGPPIVSSVVTVPGDKLDARLMALVTAFSLDPNSAGNMRLPVAINGEFGSDILPAICDQYAWPPVLGTMSIIFCNAPESLEVAARPPSTAAIEDSIPCLTD